MQASLQGRERSHASMEDIVANLMEAVDPPPGIVSRARGLIQRRLNRNTRAKAISDAISTSTAKANIELSHIDLALPRCLINRLPNELLACVFSHLPAMADMKSTRLVCSAWAGPMARNLFAILHISRDARDLEFFTRTAADEDLRWSVRAIVVHSISLLGCRRRNFASARDLKERLEMLSHRFPNVSTLTLQIDLLTPKTTKRVLLGTRKSEFEATLNHPSLRIWLRDITGQLNRAEDVFEESLSFLGALQSTPNRIRTLHLQYLPSQICSSSGRYQLCHSLCTPHQFEHINALTISICFACSTPWGVFRIYAPMLRQMRQLRSLKICFTTPPGRPWALNRLGIWFNLPSVPCPHLLYTTARQTDHDASDAAGAGTAAFGDWGSWDLARFFTASTWHMSIAAWDASVTELIYALRLCDFELEIGSFRPLRPDRALAPVSTISGESLATSFSRWYYYGTGMVFGWKASDDMLYKPRRDGPG